MYTVEQIRDIFDEAQQAGYDASAKYFQEVLGGQDAYPCGFAWVEITQFRGKKIKGNMKIGKALAAAGARQDYRRVFQMPRHGFGCQNMDCLEAGAKAAAEVLEQYGFDAYAATRID